MIEHFKLLMRMILQRRGNGKRMKVKGKEERREKIIGTEQDR